MNNLFYFILFYCILFYFILFYLLLPRNKIESCIICQKGMVDTQVKWYFSHTCVSKLS